MDKALEDSKGLRWIRERLGAYDWSKADWVSVRRGRSEKYAFRGVCKIHYLRKTRQVEGRRGEIEADAFALKMLEHYRHGCDIVKGPTRNRR